MGRHGCLHDPHRVIPAEAGIQHLHNFIPKVVPLWIVFFNKTELPRSAPFLKLFFSRNRCIHVLMKLIIHKLVNSVFFGKSHC